MKIARVFPTKTSMSPTDPDAYFDVPDLFTPHYDEVHISVTFTWDIKKAYKLEYEWQKHTKKILVGGVAINGESDQPFQAGLYLRQGITITSRGCPNNCSFCMVRQGIIEFDNFPEGNIIQDNNILACSDRHWQLVVSMLKKQKLIEFKGGLEKHRITPKIAEDLRGLRIKSLWLACDSPNDIKPLEKAVRILHKAGFRHEQIYCYVLIGHNLREENERLEKCLNLFTYFDEENNERYMGVKPFAQLFRDKIDKIKYSREYKQFARKWSRPACYYRLKKDLVDKSETQKTPLTNMTVRTVVIKEQQGEF